ncbi:hypothetical protein LLS1_12810 [Leifsonia sp. LS1]|uniref:hypothetical protein n=1 Tax=Leifsonia sp. LS1 TaxID=2828483 RepID=UPI001CFCF0A5|nr:hypothetical protein [Leifsonia sp. LS1]GIT79612.1 hypothetical protein LLS1_12810 [Leifsonia sp. LS1]
MGIPRIDDPLGGDPRSSAQLARLRAVLSAVDPSRSATELLLLDAPGPVGFVALRVVDSALRHPEGGEWRLSTIAVTGLDPERMRFVAPTDEVCRTMLTVLGGGAEHARRVASESCTAVHLLLRDQHGLVRPPVAPGEDAGRRPGQTPVPGPPP